MTFSLAELMVCAASRSFDNDGEVLATGIGLLPRLAASLAMRTSNPDMMMTDKSYYFAMSYDLIRYNRVAFDYTIFSN